MQPALLPGFDPVIVVVAGSGAVLLEPDVEAGRFELVSIGGHASRVVRAVHPSRKASETKTNLKLRRKLMVVSELSVE